MTLELSAAVCDNVIKHQYAELPYYMPYNVWIHVYMKLNIVSEAKEQHRVLRFYITEQLQEVYVLGSGVQETG